MLGSDQAGELAHEPTRRDPVGCSRHLSVREASGVGEPRRRDKHQRWRRRGWMAIGRMPVVGVASLVLLTLVSGLAQTTASAAEPPAPTSALELPRLPPGSGAPPRPPAAMRDPPRPAVAFRTERQAAGARGPADPRAGDPPRHARPARRRPRSGGDRSVRASDRAPRGNPAAARFRTRDVRSAGDRPVGIPQVQAVAGSSARQDRHGPDRSLRRTAGHLPGRLHEPGIGRRPRVATGRTGRQPAVAAGGLLRRPGGGHVRAGAPAGPGADGARLSHAR